MGNEILRPLELCQVKPAGRKKGARTEPRQFDFRTRAMPRGNRWLFPSVSYNGSYTFFADPDMKECNGAIEEGLQKLKKNPQQYYGMMYQTDMPSWPVDQQVYTLVIRDGSGFDVKREGSGFTFVQARYRALDEIDVGSQDLDEYTDTVLATYQGQRCGRPLCPGRGDGVVDFPNLKVLGEVAPEDLLQGAIGNCWLVSAIAALAEFNGVIENMFEATDGMPTDDWNVYTITLYDLPSYTPVQIQIDERLCSKPDGKSLLGCKPSPDGEIWAPLLEKAFAAHCGGWDAIKGGTSAHAWKILLGIRECCIISRKGDGFVCLGNFNPNTHQWDPVHLQHGKNGGLWQQEFPELGGGGEGPIDMDDLFDRMCQWDDERYVMGASSYTGSGSDKNTTQGIVDNHAYSILKCIKTRNGTQMLQVRNPWGKTEFSGRWGDGADAWNENPDVFEDCECPVFADDGVFWMEKDEFLTFFEDISLCPMNMSQWVREGPDSS